MPLLLLLILTLACLPDSWERPWLWQASVSQSIVLTWACVALVIILAVAISLRVRVLTCDGHTVDRALRSYAGWRYLHGFVTVGCYVLSLYVIGWGWAVQNIGEERAVLPPLAELLVLFPFLASLFGSWLVFYDAELAIHRHDSLAPDPEPFWGRWSYLVFQIRSRLVLVLIPLVLLISEKTLRNHFPTLARQWQTESSLFGLVTAVVILTIMPLIIRLILGLEPLPAGPLKDRLTAACKRLRFRCSGILMWKTRGTVANAMVVGVLPWIRYVVLTDRLAEELEPEEVEAVFGHEVGHVRHLHMFIYLGFLIASLAAVWALVAVFAPNIDAMLGGELRQELAMLPAVAVIGIYIFLVFGFLSRRCERQADLFGCRAVSCEHFQCPGHTPELALPAGGKGLCVTGILTFIHALEKVARMNGVSRSRPGLLQSWQHGTIEARVRFLEGVLADPPSEQRFERGVRLVQWGMLVSLGLLIVLLGCTFGWDKIQF